MDKYEYKVEIPTNFTREKITEICNSLGEKGWRLKFVRDGFLFFERIIVE